MRGVLFDLPSVVKGAKEPIIFWQALENVRRERFWFLYYTAIHIRRFSKRLLLRGRAGDKILEYYQQANVRH